MEKDVEIPRLENCDVCGGSGAEPGTQPINVRCAEAAEGAEYPINPIRPVSNGEDLSSLSRARHLY